MSDARINYQKPPKLVTRYRDVAGVLRKIELKSGPELESESVLPVRVVFEGDRRLIQKWVPVSLESASPGCYNLLDAEVRALSRLVQTFPGRYPDELPQMVGYNVDLREPFVLMREYRGRPVRESLGRPGPDEQLAFQRSLLWALRMTAQAGVVHNAVGFSTLRWDGSTVQLVGFERATVVPHSSLGVASSPSGFDVDIIAAGSVIRRVVLGPLSNGEVTRDPESLRELLGDVFDPQQVKRPSAAVLLSRLHAPDRPVPAVDPYAVYGPGRDEFDRVTARKREKLAPPDPAQPEPEPYVRSATPPRPRTVMIIAVIVLLAAVIAVLVMVTR